MMEKPLSIGQPKSRWDKVDTALVVVSVVAVGSGFLFFERFNQPREKVRSVFKGDQIPTGSTPADRAAPDSTHQELYRLTISFSRISPVGISTVCFHLRVFGPLKGT